MWTTRLSITCPNKEPAALQLTKDDLAIAKTCKCLLTPESQLKLGADVRAHKEAGESVNRAYP